MKCGEIWFVDFGESIGYEYKKERPAVIVESDGQLKITSVVTIIPLTSQNKKHKDDIFMPKNKLNNLYYDSIIKVHNIQSFDKLRFIHKIGEVEDDALKEIKNYLKKHFSL